MADKSKILHQINELEIIKSAYNHFLSSYRATKEVENATNIRSNKKILIAALKKLYNELHTEGVKPANVFHNKISRINYKYSKLEKSVIAHFNSDNRFKITE
ncbi:hypothetical protein [Flavobacterium sp. MK4S-17]|uniref:hypothetical protein n=1 Tax=Flavobacterium sp. MK4S-17 TaxID=2543737 RepID=UPI00135826FB|nr:hypothetical protein [Flavobacterium sp. MK4S-17]